MYHYADGMIKVADTYMSKVEVGTRLKFDKRGWYTVQASNRMYSVCTRPLNMIRRIGRGKYKHQKTVLYTIVDWVHNIRGTENLVFGMGAETRKDCEEMLKRITNGDSDISQRNWTNLLIEKYKDPNKK